MNCQEIELNTLGFPTLLLLIKKMVIYYLRSGFQKPEKRAVFLRGILEEMLRSSNERYDIEDSGSILTEALIGENSIGFKEGV